MEKEAIEGYETRMVPPKRILFRLEIPYNLRFPLIWIAFFAILGIIIQSIKAETFVFTDFFWRNYIDWFKSFGSFTDPAYYGNEMAVIFAILKHWYYFFYTGGLISLIWVFVSWLINFEFVFKKKQPEVKEQKIIQPVIIEKPVVIPSKPAEIPKASEAIEVWLEKGYELLAEGRIKDASLIYQEIRKEYSPEKDPDGRFYKRIVEFYNELIESSQGKKKQQETWEG